MNIEQILSLPLAETFLVDGRAPNVLAAHNMAWDGLTGSLSTDPVAAWAMKVMQHSWVEGGVVFHAEFARDPNFEATP